MRFLDYFSINKKLILLLFFIVIPILLISSSLNLTAFADEAVLDQGDGTEGSPYVITTCGQLQLAGEVANLSSYFILNNDIDCSDTVNWNDGKGFAPIGTTTNRFVGNFNGNGFKITGLFINRIDTTDVNIGLFGYIGVGGVVSRLGMLDADITGYNFVGSIVGYNLGTISESYSNSAKVTATYNSTSTYLGGFAGQNDGSIINSYFLGSVVSGSSSRAGGLTGRVGATGQVVNSYSIPVVSGGSSIRGLNAILTSGGSVTASFWDTFISGLATSNGGIGKTATELKTTSTFTDVSWDFDAVWAIDDNRNSGYPYLINNDTGIDRIIEVTTIEDLQNIANNPGDRYIQTVDIDASATDAWNDGSGFLPIPMFYGQYDGDGFTISNLTIDRSSTDYVGIFARNKGSVSNIKVFDSSIIGQRYTGGIVGYNWELFIVVKIIILIV